MGSDGLTQAARIAAPKENGNVLDTTGGRGDARQKKTSRRTGRLFHFTDTINKGAAMALVLIGCTATGITLGRSLCRFLGWA